MADAIKLPPLPEPPAWMNDEGDVFARQETPEMELSLPTMLYTTNQLRARDIEVARLVLEAAANLCDQQAREAYKRWRSKENAYDDGGCDIANMLVSSIRALEVHHHE